MSLLSAVTDFLKPAPPPDPLIEQALARVGELVDPRLKSVGGFAHQLAAPLHYALGYCDGLIASLPGPVDMTRHAFASDPLVHALFATADDIDQMLGRSQAIRDYLAEPASREHDHFHALFAARRQQKGQLGMSMQGEVLHNDVPQQVLYFSGQTLIEPAGPLATTREHLRRRALDSLLTSFHDHLECLRNERDGMRSDLSAEITDLTIRRGKANDQEYELRSRHIAELDQRLRESVASLAPEHLLQALASFLHAPEPSLNLVPVSITVDRQGVISRDEGDQINTHTLKFPELSSRDKRLHMVMLARINRDEARAAVDRVRDQQHRFMLL